MFHQHAFLKSGVILLAVLLAGCSYSTQTTSGRDYLAAVQLPPAQAANDIDAQIRAAADVEPTLRFPARIGLARIGRESVPPFGAARFGGETARVKLMPPSAEESEAWLKLAKDLGPEFGEFVAVSPLIAALVSNEPPTGDSLKETMNTIRVTAARQHLDAVLIYEAEGTADNRTNPLAIANLSIIGAFVLPSHNVKAQGIAQAMLVDVRNAYPYGTIQAEANDQTLAVQFGNDRVAQDLSKRVAAAAVENLTHEARDMMRELKVKLAALDKKR